MSRLSIDQCLYGYKNGHELLASSRKLSPQVRNRLLVLSDLSGSHVAPGFETYLTGTPISDDTYAVLRTWCAPEISRPGAVWSHVFFLGPEHFADRLSLVSLAQQFRRPERTADGFSVYESPIALAGDTFGAGLPAVPGLDSVDIVAVLDAVFRPDGKSVVMIAGAPTAYESALLRAWDLMWPTAQREFRFCTGALTLRNDDFDFQVAPPRLAQVGKIPPGTIVVSSEESSTAARHPLIEHVAKALAEPGSDLPVFLRSVGEGLKRDSLLLLLEVYRTLSERAGGAGSGRIVELVTSRFPTPTQARQLKSHLFGCKASGSPLVAVDLVDLVRSPAGESLDAEEVGLDERVGDILRQKPAKLNAVVEVLGEETTPLAKIALRSIVAGLSIGSTDVPKPRLSRRAAMVCLSVDPTLAGSRGFWGGTEARFPDVWQAVRTSSDTTKAAVVGAFLSTCGPRGLGSVIDLDADALLQSALWIDTLGSEGGEWIEELTEVAGGRPRRLWECASHVAVPQSVLWSLSSLAKVRDAEVRRTSGWSRLSVPCPFRAGPLLDRSDAFLFALALRSDDPSEARLVRGRFSSLHLRLANSSLDYRAWSALSDELPGSRWDWDRCGRLVRGMAELVVSASFEAEEISGSCESDELFAHLLSALSKERDLRRYLTELERKSRRSPTLPLARRKMLADAAR